jgi:hypothetical protein
MRRGKTRTRGSNRLATFHRRVWYRRSVTREGLFRFLKNKAWMNPKVNQLLSYEHKHKNQPLKPAAFSPWRPNPYPFLSGFFHVPNSAVSGVPSFSIENERCTASSDGLAKTGLLSCDVGRTPLDSARQEVIDRFCLADSRKMRPRSMLRHPIEKRKKAATRVKSST